MANILLLNQARVDVGLPILTFTIPSTGLYTVSAQVTVPATVGTEGLTSNGAAGYGDLQGGAGSYPLGLPSAAVNSVLVVTVKQNGSTVYTSPTISNSHAQPALQFSTLLNCTSGDAIEVDYTSANSGIPQADGGLNVIQSNTSIRQGM